MCNYIFHDSDIVELYEIKSFNPSNSNLIFLFYYGHFYTKLDGYWTKNYYVILFCITYKILKKRLSKISEILIILIVTIFNHIILKKQINLFWVVIIMKVQ